MKNMNSNTSKLVTTATSFIAAVNGAINPFTDIFAALAEPAGKPTAQTIVDMLPHTMDDSPTVEANELYGRGWDASWSAWVDGTKEKYNTGMEVSFSTQVSLSWTAPVWSEYIEGY